MNKKECQEIKRALKWENDQLYISKVATAYALIHSEEKKVLSYDLKDFTLLSQEEGELYLDIFKKSLSGTLGKNLLEFRFPRIDEQINPVQKELHSIVENKLAEEEKFRQFVDQILANGHFVDSIYITMAYCEYNVPLKSKNLEASYEDGYTYRFILCAINPAKQTEIGLFYNREANEVERKVNVDMEILANPSDAFLYPCFSERASDVNHVLYHAKNAKSINPFFIEDVLRCDYSLSPLDEESGFTQMIVALFEDRLTPEILTNIHENIFDAIQESEEDPSAITYSKSNVKELLNYSGADEKSMENFDAVYKKIFDDQDLKAINMTNISKMAIRVPDITINVKNGGDTKVKTDTINGKKCLVIEMDESVEINGIELRP